MRSFVAKTLLSIAVLSGGVLGAFPTDARAQTSPTAAPTLIPVSGELRTADVQPRTGTVLLVISLYEGQNDPAPRWVEHQQVTLDAAGRYSVQFGATRQDGLPADLFTGEAATRWIGVAVEGEAEQPRVTLVSVPYAAKAASADTLAGKPASDFVLASTLREDVRTVVQEEVAANDITPADVISGDTTVDGRLTVTGFGTHMFSASGPGSNSLRIRNMSGGSADFSSIQLGNDQTDSVGSLYAFSTAYNSSGPYVANGFTFDGGNSGGLSLAATHGSGAIRFYSGGSNERMRLDAAGRLNVYGFGSHVFSAGGTGQNSIRIRNTDSGSGNFSALHFGNDLTDTAASFYLFSSNYNTSGPYVANGLTLDAGAGGGLSLAATSGSGTVRFYAGGSSERMRITNAGRIGIGTSAPNALLHVAGDVIVDGNIGAKYQDVAEWVEAAEPLAAGTVVVIHPDRDNVVTDSKTPYSSSVVGAVSPQPGLILGESGPNKVLVAQSGRVRVKVDASYGAVKRGDLLVTSPRAGYAMKSKPVKMGSAKVHRPGTVLGKALESLSQGEGEILVLLTLQ
jgi:hypothetical protein